MSDLSHNMTDEHMDAVMSALPDEMDVSELCALTLTIHSAYLDDTADIMSALISAIYTYGACRGMSSKTVSAGLRMSADLHDENPKTKH